jgi:hypothetical protein
MTKHKFRIGDLVLVKGGIRLEDEKVSLMKYERKVLRAPLDEKRQFRAVVTGATFRTEGFTNHGYGDDGGKEFIAKRQVPLWLVRRSVTSAEHLVFEEDLEMVTPVFHREEYAGREVPKRPGKPLIPWKPPGQVVSQAVRDELKDVMKDWPRNAKGRWLRNAPPISGPCCPRCSDTGRIGNDIPCDCIVGKNLAGG